MESSTASSAGYEVFLSFRGVDTRQGFTDILYEYMTMAEIRVFRDDDELAIGDKIDSILVGLATSKICIPIFSPKFAGSKWCLREVAHMVDLKKTIVPVFYKVSPDDVKLKGGSVYLDDIRQLEAKQGPNHVIEIDKWKNALKEAGSVKGRELGHKSYSRFCKELVDEVLSKLGPRKRLEIDNFTGDANKARAMNLLDMGSNKEVVYVGIHGMGGIGKTTITKLIYNEFLSSFDYCGFLPDIRESLASKGIKSLPSYLYDNLQPKSVAPFSHSGQIADRFKNKKVLLILDDVDSYEQIREIAWDSSWFGLGSRIVLTTRNKKVLEDYADASRSEIRYLEMDELKIEWALELFSRCAFETDSPPSPYLNLSKKAVSYAGGLPLAITVIAKYLRNRKEEVWEEIIERLKKTPLKEVKDKLLISYNALEEEHKEIFLDIACLLTNAYYIETSNLFYMWEACGFCPRWSIEVLQSMSLVKVDQLGRLIMHDQLRDLGRDIVRTKSGGDIMKRSRLSEFNDSTEVPRCKTKQESNIVALQLVTMNHNRNFSDEEFISFDKLRYLQCGFSSKLQGNFSGLLPQLKWLQCVYIIEARNLLPSNLVILELSDSDINEKWDGWSQIQALKKLKCLNLERCKLRSTPVFSGNMALERLSMDKCESLTIIDPSIGKLHHLNYLSFYNCDNIKNLPESLGELHALRELCLARTSITSLPDSIGRLDKLERLDLSDCRTLLDLPESLGNLRSLVDLGIRSTKITRFPCSLGGLEKLESFGLHNLEITLLPESFGDLNLVHLDIYNCHITVLPPPINQLSLLQTLWLNKCHQLHELTELPSSLTELKINSKSLKKVFDLSNLQDVTSLELTGGSSILDWTGSFPSKLQSITIELFSISKLPDLTSCSLLRYLKLSCKCSLKALPNMSGLRKLLTLEIEHCMELVEIPGIGKLHCLTSLFIKDCPSLVCLENLRELQELKEFTLVRCQKLTEIPGIGKLQALTKVIVQDCESLEKFDDLTVLKELKELSLVGCLQLVETLGLEDLTKLEPLGLENLTKLKVQYIFSLDIQQNVRYLKNHGVPSTSMNSVVDSPSGEVPGHGDFQILDLLADQMPRSSDHQLENMSEEAEANRHRQFMGSDLSLNCLPAEQSEAEDCPHRKRRRYQSISTQEGRLNSDDLSLRL